MGRPALFVFQHRPLLNLPNWWDAIGHFTHNNLHDQMWAWIFLCWLIVYKKENKNQERSEGTLCKGLCGAYLVCHDLSNEGNVRSQLLDGSSILREGFELIRPWKASDTLAIMCPGYPQLLTCFRMVWKSRLMKSQALTLQSQQLLQLGEQKPWSPLWCYVLSTLARCRAVSVGTTLMEQRHGEWGCWFGLSRATLCNRNPVQAIYVISMFLVAIQIVKRNRGK